MLLRKEYIGDSVYAEFNGWGVTLTTENGRGPSNTIVLEPEVLRALNRVWAGWHDKALAVKEGA